MLSIRDLREIFDVRNSTIYGWEKQGLLVPTKRTEGGLRRWSVEDVETAMRKITKAQRYRERFSDPEGRDA